MMVSFDNPVWWLLGAALVPLLVHLVARARPKEKRFSSIALLQELARLQARRARPKDWLLLLLRSLACGCLASAFLLPYIGEDGDGEGGQALILVLDDTASMGAADGQQVRMNQALEAAQAAVKSLGPRDRINFAALSGFPHFLFDKPESASPLVLRELALTQSQPVASAGVADALESACKQLRELPEGVKGRLLLVSDFQAGTMQGPVRRLLKKAEGLDIRCVSVAQSPSVENTAVTSISLAPAHPLPGQDVIATVSLRHWNGAAASDQPITQVVTLSAGDLRLSQPCELPRGGRASVQFKLTAPSAGGSWALSARIAADAYPGDNVRYLVVDVVEKLDCLAISSDRAQLGFMLRALENTPFLRTLCLPALPEAAADFVVWNAPSVADVPAIQARLVAGATVLVVPDLIKDTACRLLLTGQAGEYAGEMQMDGGRWSVEPASEREAAFSLFSADALRSLCSSPVYARLGAGFAQPLPAGTAVLLRYSDGVPALLRKSAGRGCLLVWNMPVVVRDSQWGFSPLFLPLLAETLLSSRGDADDSQEAVAGQDHLSFALPSGVEPSAVRLLDQQGREVPVAPQPARAGLPPQLCSESPVLPGMYRWVAGNDELAVAAVNFPLEESDLVSFVPEGQKEGSIISPSEAASQSASAFRTELWPWLLGAAFLFLIAELLICRKPRRKQPVKKT